MSIFTENIKSLHGDAGKKWLNSLDSIVFDLAKKWDLTNLKAFDNLTFNYVMSGFQTPNELHPLIGNMERTCFLKNIITRQNIVIGDYTYYDDENDVRNFEKNVLYHFDFLGDKLIIGKFCQIASGAKFLMNGMFHMNGCFSTYPFAIFSEECRAKYPPEKKYPFKGDTIVGNDVWIGYGTTFMAGVRIGDGAIIGTNSLVTKDVRPYEVWGGNPAKLIKKRFSDDVIDLLLKIQWWNWDIEKIVDNVGVLVSGDIEKLKTLT